MSNGNGHRWSKFWWCDWQNDVALKRCSLAAHGLWMMMLCIAHEGEPCGYLRLNGQPLTAADLNDMIAKTTVKEVEKLLAELEAKGVFSRAADGAIYSRRMVKDTAVSEQASQWGKKGGNPTLNPKGGLTPPLNPKHGNGVNPYPYPPPLNQKLEAEEEAEEEPTPTPSTGRGGTPAEPGTPPAGRRADGTNPRAVGTNPRANGNNSRTAGTNPRAPARQGYASGGIAVLAGRLGGVAARRPHA